MPVYQTFMQYVKISQFLKSLFKWAKENLRWKKIIQDKKNVTDDFKIIYKFPYIALTRGFCRLKIYQTGLTCLAVPFVGYCTHVGTLTSQALISTLTISGLAFLMLCVMGEIFRKIVGHIYINSERDLVKISHLTFWGGRRDIVIPTEDLVPLTDTTENPRDIYIRLFRYSKPKHSLYMCLRFGGIIDIERFSYVFGEFP